MIVGAVLFIPQSKGLDARSVDRSRPEDLVKLGLKFDGAASCNAAKCHGSDKPKPPPSQAGDEYTHWAAKDPHNRAFETLTKDASKAIATKMSIADASTAERCLSCHSVNAPASLRGQKFSLNEGVSCNACHGPSQKYMEPHATEGWTAKQRQAMGHADLLKTWGLYDTKPLVARAEKCTSCHLAIDADMVAAGHPQPQFELAYFSNAGVYEDRHWKDPVDEKYFDVKQWTAGQVVETRDAMVQLAERAEGKAPDEAVKAAYEQALGHLAMFKQVAASGLLNADAGSLDGLAGKLKAAMGAGNKGEVAAAARSVAEGVARTADGVGQMSADKGKTLKALNAVASDESVAQDAGHLGMEQQAFAVFTLYNAYANAESPADKDQVIGLIGEKLFPEKKADAAAFAKNLADVKGKLPAQ